MLEYQYPAVKRRTELLGRLASAGDVHHTLMVLAMNSPDETLESTLKLLEAEARASSRVTKAELLERR